MMTICSLQDIRPLALAPPPPVISSRSGVNDVANRSAAIHSVFDFIRPRLHCYNFAIEPYYNIPNYSSLGSTQWSKKASSLQRRGSNITPSPTPRISVMCPNPPTPNLPNMIIWITKIHTPSPLLPLHRSRHFDPVSLEMLLPCLDVRPRRDSQAEMLLQGT
jgi:hypothetical protein